MRIQIVIYFIYTLYIKNKLLACVTKVEQQKHKCKTKLKEKQKNTIYHSLYKIEIVYLIRITY